MTPRERVLAGLTAATVILVIGLLGLRSLYMSLNQKQERIDDLQAEISRKEDKIFEGSLAADRLRALIPKSLPRSKELATQAYDDWLFRTAQELGFEAVNINPQGELAPEGAYQRQKYIFSGRGNIEQVTNLLYAFYEKDYLHRITNMRWAPGTKPYEIVTTIDLETIALNIAEDRQSPPSTKSNRLSGSLEDYRRKIAGRNLFAEANLPPEFSRQAKTETVLGDRMSYEVSAKDPEALPVEYALDGEVPDGMRIDAKSGRLTWNPKAIGKYDVLIVAKDTGIPAMSSLQKLTIDVQEPKAAPPPAKEKNFDIAAQAEVTAFLASGGKAEVWIHSKTDSKVYNLKVGDDLKLGSVTGKIIAIGATFAEIETDGRRWTVGQDESLADAYRRSDID